MAVPVRREDLIRVEMLDKPHEFGKGHGLYEWRWMNDKYTLDIFDLKREIEGVEHVTDEEKVTYPFKEHSERILDRIHNFPVLFLNKRTGEVTSR